MSKKTNNENETPIIYIGLENKKPVEFMDNNRPINKSLVKKLETSMEKYGILSALTVYDAGKTYQVVDGQHRWTAATNLGLTMPAIVTSDLSAMQAVMEMNTIGKNWSMTDYVDFYSVHDDSEIRKAYTILKDKKKIHPEYNYGSIHRIYGKPIGATCLSRGIVRIESIGMGDAIIRQIEELVEYIPLAKTTRFIQAYSYIARHENYNHARMMRKLEAIGKDSHLLVCASNPSDYGRMLTKVYNFKQSVNLTLFRTAWI
jgi:hypothetical protein